MLAKRESIVERTRGFEPFRVTSAPACALGLGVEVEEEVGGRAVIRIIVAEDDPSEDGFSEALLVCELCAAVLLGDESDDADCVVVVCKESVEAVDVVKTELS